jgi:hypothetical protein
LDHRASEGGSLRRPPGLECRHEFHGDPEPHERQSLAAQDGPWNFESNPIGGWYVLKKGFRGRFGVYLPPLMEELGLCELEHNAKNNRMRAK